MSSVQFRPGKNIAMKVSESDFDATVAFYERTLALTRLTELAPEYVFEFGDKRLWVDRVPGLAHAETWFEIIVDDTAEAAAYLQRKGVTRCDDAEKLPASLDGFWVANPAGVVHLVCHPSSA